MANPMKIRALAREGGAEGRLTEVRVQMAHDMETGQRRDEAGALVPAWYITDLVATHNGRVVLQAEFGTAVSRDPYLSFRFRGGARGDRVVLTWRDNRGDSRTDEVLVT